MTFEGTDCRLAEVGRLADQTGGRVNIVNIGTVATEIQSALADNILATGVRATLLAADGMYFPYEECNHCLVRDIGNVTEGVEITFQFACKPDSIESFMRRDRLPFQLQLSFTTRDQQKVTRIITEQRRLQPAASNTEACMRAPAIMDDCMITLSVAERCVLSPLLNSLFNHDCVAKHDSNTIIKFDDTTVVGLITYNDETAYREEVRGLAVWCQDNNLSLNVNKTKELLVDYMTRRAEQAPTNIDGTEVEWSGSREQV
ncbi:uncharacterized protein LOC135571344 [Oncorhynchus nerka]|uniref:uncharacterized protein LOC135571344 n=1 Tax=Oncorhynchus nerka TaxID=8023 RepID=UPI0031B8626F